MAIDSLANDLLALLEVDTARRPPRIRFANLRAAFLYGRPVEQFCDLPLSTLYESHAAVAHERLLAQASAGRAAQIETLHLKPLGDRIAVRLHASRSAPDGLGVLLAVENISDEIERRTQVEAIDEERRRIAQELHDTVVQDLAAIHMEIALWRDHIGQSPEYVAGEMIAVLRELKAEIDLTRRTIFALRPVELEQSGFAVTLQKLAHQMEARYGLVIELRAPFDTLALPASLELPLLRILQEALNNAGRHAGASRVTVTFQIAFEDLCVDVEDDGAGFVANGPGTKADTGHYGLLQIRERAASVGGEVDISSAPDRGTRIRVLLPGCFAQADR